MQEATAGGGMVSNPKTLFKELKSLPNLQLADEPEYSPIFRPFNYLERQKLERNYEDWLKARDKDNYDRIKGDIKEIVSNGKIFGRISSSTIYENSDALYQDITNQIMFSIRKEGLLKEEPKNKKEINKGVETDLANELFHLINYHKKISQLKTFKAIARIFLILGLEPGPNNIQNITKLAGKIKKRLQRII